MCSEKKCSAHFKAVLDYSWIIVDTTLLHQHRLYYSRIALICHIVKTVQVVWFKVPIRTWPVRIKSYVIQCLAERKFGSGHWQYNNKKINHQVAEKGWCSQSKVYRALLNFKGNKSFQCTQIQTRNQCNNRWSSPRMQQNLHVKNLDAERSVHRQEG